MIFPVWQTDYSILYDVQVDAETDQRLTYRELGVIVERLAYNLSLFGVQKNEVFGISSINSIQYVVLYLACMRLGALPCLISNLATKGRNIKTKTNKLGSFHIGGLRISYHGAARLICRAYANCMKIFEF